MRISTTFNVLMVLLLTSLPPLSVPAHPEEPELGTTLFNHQSILEIKQRLSELEHTQALQIEALRSSNVLYQWIVGAIGTFLAIFVTVLTFHQLVLAPRKQRRRDAAELSTVQRVSEIMGVVKETLQSRLDSEKQAREELVEVKMEVSAVSKMFDRMKTIITNMRTDIETQALHFASKRSRHEFREIQRELSRFRGEYVKFQVEYEPMEEKDVKEKIFSSRVFYILGIAEHYLNCPDEANKYFRRVINEQNKINDEPESAFIRRKANCYYYLGIIESNFGNFSSSIENFEEAKNLDPKGMDYLTKVVTGEAYSMNGDLNDARDVLKEVIEATSEETKLNGRIKNSHLRLQSRAILVLANIEMLEKSKGCFARAADLIRSVHETEPDYYYATATLGQVYSEQGDSDGAKRMFENAYSAFERSGHLRDVTEVRTQILLRMMAAMCCRGGINNTKQSDKLLDYALDLCGNLPKMDNLPCTVFSILSKRNESSDIIRTHIEKIRNGETLLLQA